MHARITSVGLLIKPNPADTFTYPDHIDRASLDALPALPGIYIFRDAQNVPLYIGKSVNIRSRVLSHLRTPEEARMLQQTSHIEFRRTAGEVGALLLEARLIKEMHPVHNKKLRRLREMCALRLEASSQQRGAIEVVYAREHDFAKTDGLYGLFATRKAALEKLRTLVDMHMLCPATVGLETVARGRACFAKQIGRCLGACAGAESLDDHHARLMAALEPMRIMVWPYAGPMAIVEEHDGWRQLHMIDHWSYLGSIDASDDQSILKIPSKRVFDVDTYHILAKSMLRGDLLIIPVTHPAA